MVFTENEKVELKEIYVDDIRKEVIAFANTEGGTIYIGVQDDGTVKGLMNIDEVSLQVTNSCRDSIKPDVMMFVKCEQLKIDKKDILAIHVQRGTGRPYYLSSKGLKSSGVFVRQGTSSVQASDISIRTMIKETDGDSFEDVRSFEQNLTFYEAESMFTKRNIDFGEVQKRNLGLYNRDSIYTNLALLLSDQCPHIIKAATFTGIEQEVFHDRKEFTGSLLKQLTDAYDYLIMRNQLRATFEGLMRIDSKDYSDDAIRESLLNTIVHRDYSQSASTLISVYDNRMEFVSFGGLAGGVTLQDVLFGLSVCRNPKLANIFYRLNLIESYGTGLKRIRDSYKSFDMKPEFLAAPNAFKVILPNRNENKEKLFVDQEEQSQKVIDYIKRHGRVTRIDVENLLHINTTAAVRLLKKMKDIGTVYPVGKGKNTYYKL